MQQIFLYDLTAISLGVGQNLFPVAPNDGGPLTVLREVYNTDSISPLLYYPKGVLLTRSWDDVEALAHKTTDKHHSQRPALMVTDAPRDNNCQQEADCHPDVLSLNVPSSVHYTDFLGRRKG